MRTSAARLLPGALALALALAGCGGGATTPTTTRRDPAPASPLASMRALVRREPSLAGTLRVLFVGSGWSLVQSTRGGDVHALLFRLRGGRWQLATAPGVTIQILGPQPGSVSPALAQVGMEVRSRQPLIETALWIDGRELETEGGGTPTNGTIYGDAAKRLPGGLHVAVAYARSASAGLARAWTFTVAG